MARHRLDYHWIIAWTIMVRHIGLSLFDYWTIIAGKRLDYKLNNWTIIAGKKLENKLDYWTIISTYNICWIMDNHGWTQIGLFIRFIGQS